MNIIFYGDSLTEGIPGISYFNILKERLPQHDLVNCGKGGDTVISLLERVKKINTNKKYDIAFIWIGVNDVLPHIKKRYGLIKLFCNQPWAKNNQIFKRKYKELIELVSKKSERVFTVSLPIIGEGIHNRWNKKLELLSLEIDIISSKFQNVEYINLHEDIISYLSTKKTSQFIMNSILRDVILAWMLNIPGWIEKKSERRGLYLTIDGVHFNNTGANIVANKFYKSIIDSHGKNT